MAETSKKGKDEAELKALIAHEIQSAIAYDSTELSEKRTRAIEYFYGDMRDTPAAQNRSSVVSRDTSDVIGWILPGIMRTFMASGRIVEYEPQGREDEEFCEQASDTIHYIFMKENDGYRVLYNATHDSLLQGNGIVKHYWDDYEDTEVTEHTGLNEMQLAELVNPDNVEVLAASSDVQYLDDGMPYPVYDVKIKRVKSYGRLCIEVIEPENFLMDKDLVTLEEGRFCAHRQEKMRSDLIEMGFRRKDVMALPGDRGTKLTQEELARQGDRVDIDDSMDAATDLIELFECYVKTDIDGDGITETVRAYYAGNDGNGELLDWEVWEDEYPFSDIPCEPVPHRWDAQAVSDQTMDMQRVKTVLFRGALDNMYATARPQVEIEEGSVVNLDALVSPKFGQPIFRRKGAPQSIPHVIPFVADKLFMAMQAVDDVIEKRTGVSRSTMALDPDALQNQTATAVQAGRDASYSKVELVARNMAELGWKKVFRKCLRILVKHQDKPKTIRLRNEFVDVDPKSWNADMDCTVNIGLGTGSRDRDMAMLSNVAMAQTALADRLTQFAPQSPTLTRKALELLPKIIDTMVKQGEAAGIRNADDYYPTFEDQDLQMILGEVGQAMQGQGQDPKVQAEQQKLQMQAEAKKAELQLDQQKAQQDAALAERKAQQDAMLAEKKAQNEIALKERQMSAELELKRQQLNAELAMQERRYAAEMAMKERLGVLGEGVKAATSGVHMGGEPG